MAPGLGPAAYAQLSIERRSPIVDIQAEPTSVYDAIFGSPTPGSPPSRLTGLGRRALSTTVFSMNKVVIVHDDHGDLVVQDQ